MRPIKSMLPLALGLLATAAMPGIASADWTTEGAELTGTPTWSESGTPIGAEATVSLSGSFNVSGGVNCETANGSLALEPGGAEGQVTKFSAVPGNCTLSGTAKSLGCTTVTAVSAESLPWKAKAVRVETGRQIDLSGVKITYTLEGGKFCPGVFTVSGGLTAMPDDSQRISSLSVSANGLKSSWGTSGNSAGGTLGVSPAESYGILEEGGSIGMNGSLSFTGGTVCSNIDAALILEPGTSGLMTEMTWNSPGSHCQITGTWKSLGCTGVESVTTAGLPWTINDTGSYIEVPNADFDYHMAGGAFCPSQLHYTGELTLTPDSTEAMTSFSIGGELDQSGFATVIPAGEMGITSGAGSYGL